MSPDQFLLVGNLFSEAALLLDRRGTVLAANRHVRRLGLDAGRITGHALSEFASTPPEQIEEYLRACARSRDPVIGALRLRNAHGEELVCRCDGARVDGDSQPDRAQLLVKLARKQETLSQFALLNRKIVDLTAEIHRRRQVEKELWDQRESLRVTLASIGDGVIVTDSQGRITFLNPVAETLTGWTQAEAEGRDLDQVFPIVNEHTREKADNPALRALREGRLMGLANHTLLISREGREWAIDDSAAPVFRNDGQLLGVVLVFRDVTETRRLETARARLAALVESSDDAIIAKAFDGVVFGWNAAAERLFGYTAEETLGRPLYETIVPPDRKEELLAVLDRVRRGERVEHFETVRVAKDGRRIPISLRISPIQNAAGEVLGASAIERDITQQKRAEATLRFLADASASLAMLVDYKSTLQKVARLAVPHFADWCAVDVVAADGAVESVAIAHVDPAKVALAEEFRRRYPRDPNAPWGVSLVLGAGRPDMMSEFTDEVLAAGAIDEEHVRMLRQLGCKSYMCVPLAARGRVLGVVTFVSAESGRRYTEEDLAVAEDLAHRATIAIENARLYQEVREADRRKDEFLAMLAHELRNPLAPIRTGLDVLALEGSGDPSTLQLMREQVEHLVRLVDDLLDVSRIVRGKIELRREPVEATGILRRAVEAIRPAINQHGQELVVSTPDRPIWLQADPVRLVQVLGNLLHNASKFTDRGGRIELSARREGAQAVFRVRDNGVGIEPELLPKVFDLFTQASRSLDRSQGGLGIGLTLVRNLVEMHGGTVSAHSQGSGKGSEFLVRLPLTEEATTARREQAQPDKSPGRRVLVVDDNAGAAQMLALLLKTLGPHQVELAYDGPSALEVVERFRPEIVLLDIGLPTMDGYQVGQRIRRNSNFQPALLVALTGYGQEEDRRKSREFGFDEHLVKPLALKQVEGLLAHPKLQRRAEE